MDESESKPFNTDVLALGVIWVVAVIMLVSGEPIGVLATLAGIVQTIRFFMASKERK